MNISELFEMQRVLDERIIKEHGLEGKGLLQERVLALNVEIAELAQETRCFKFWSKNKKQSDRVLDELVDVLHFILSIGLETNMDKKKLSGFNDFMIRSAADPYGDLSYLLGNVFIKVAELNKEYIFGEISLGYWQAYESLLCHYVALTKQLGFESKQVVEAYKAKNAENHARQDRGY